MVHLDFVASDIDTTLACCVAAGAVLTQAPRTKAWGRIAILADPIGHGRCLLDLHGRHLELPVEPPAAGASTR